MSAFTSVVADLGKSSQGLVKGATSALDSVGTQLAGSLGALPGELATAVTGATGDLVSSVGGEILGSIGDSGGVLSTLAGALGGVFDTQAGRKTWGKLNPALIAQIYACDSQGEMIETGYVSGPITDDNLDMTLNWQSPFEHTGPENKAPSIMAMLQSGQFATVINALQASGIVGSSSTLDGIADNAQQAVRTLEGRTGITRLNSRQVFSGMPGIKLNMTLHLRALQDTQRELMEQYERIMAWSLPQQLANDSFLSGIIRQSGDVAGMLSALFPSQAPRMVSLYYGRLAFPPMVIESVSHPLSAPKASDGHWIYLPVQIQMSTLTAMDRTDLAYLFM